MSTSAASIFPICSRGRAGAGTRLRAEAASATSSRVFSRAAGGAESPRKVRRRVPISNTRSTCLLDGDSRRCDEAQHCAARCLRELPRQRLYRGARSVPAMPWQRDDRADRRAHEVQRDLPALSWNGEEYFDLPGVPWRRNRGEDRAVGVSDQAGHARRAADSHCRQGECGAARRRGGRSLRHYPDRRASAVSARGRRYLHHGAGDRGKRRWGRRSKCRPSMGGSCCSSSGDAVGAEAAAAGERRAAAPKEGERGDEIVEIKIVVPEAETCGPRNCGSRQSCIRKTRGRSCGAKYSRVPRTFARSWFFFFFFFLTWGSFFLRSPCNAFFFSLFSQLNVFYL